MGGERSAVVILGASLMALIFLLGCGEDKGSPLGPAEADPALEDLKEALIGKWELISATGPSGKTLSPISGVTASFVFTKDSRFLFRSWLFGVFFAEASGTYSVTGAASFVFNCTGATFAEDLGEHSATEVSIQGDILMFTYDEHYYNVWRRSIVA